MRKVAPRADAETAEEDVGVVAADLGVDMVANLTMVDSKAYGSFELLSETLLNTS